jgi:hypothetical protein
MKINQLTAALRCLAYAAIAVLISEPELKVLYAVLALTEIESIFQ